MLKLADMDSKSRFYNSAHWNKRKYACINEDVKNLSRGKKRNYLKRTKRKFLNLKKCNFETKISLNRLNSKLDMTEKSLNLKIDRQYPIWRIKIFFKIFFFGGGTPWWFSQDSALSLQRARVQSLVRELISWKAQGAANLKSAFLN